MPKKAKRRTPRQAFILLKSGQVPADFGNLFVRLFWRSQTDAMLARNIWNAVKESGRQGLDLGVWHSWKSDFRISVGRLYRILNVLQGAGMIEKASVGGPTKWFTSTGFMRELESLLYWFSNETQFETNVRRWGGTQRCARCGFALGNCQDDCECPCGKIRTQYHSK